MSVKQVFGLSQPLTLYHGSSVRVKLPQFGLGNPHNDYGLGFYCTEHEDLAKEWACPTTGNGYVNTYLLDHSRLAILNLEEPGYTTLNRLALLVKNRSFDITTPLMGEAQRYILERHLVDTSPFDVIVGYRADDSYFSFACAFLDNRISLRQLEYALKLGELGRQVVLISPKAFNALAFVYATPVQGSLWHPKRQMRDQQARESYRTMLSEQAVRTDDVFMMDILRSAL